MTGRPKWYSEPQLVGFTDHLSTMFESPLAYDERGRQRAAGESSDTASRAKLRCTHALILEGAAAVQRSFVVSDVVRRKGTAPFEAVLAEAAGRAVLNPCEWSAALAQASAVGRHWWIRRQLDEWRGDGWRMVVEQPMRWRETVAMADPPAVLFDGQQAPEIELVEVECKGITDALAVHAGRREGVIIDCKEIPTTVPRPLFAHFERMLYHVQAAQYLAGAAAAVPWVKSWRYLWLGYTGRAPFDALWVELSEDDREYGATVRTDLLRRIVHHRRTGRADGRHTGIVESRLPAWQTRDTADVEEVW